MEFVEKLKELKLFKPEMDILDIGCRNGWLFDRLNKPGRNYDGVDMFDYLESKEGIRFFRESFTEFVPDKKYDLIFAKEVFFFQPDQVKHAARYANYLKPGGVFCVAFMIEDDPHVGSVAIDGNIFYGVTQEEIDRFLVDKEVLWKQDFNEEALNLANQKKQWHLCNVFFRNK